MSAMGASTTGASKDEERSVLVTQLGVPVSQSSVWPNVVQSASFPQVPRFIGAEIALTSLSMFNSWFNISAARGNNWLMYAWPVSVSGTDQWQYFYVTLADGSYTIDEVNQTLQNAMLANLTYLLTTVTATNPVSTVVYPLQIVDNSGLYYRTTVTSFPVPVGGTSAQYTSPSGQSWTPNAQHAEYPALYIPGYVNPTNPTTISNQTQETQNGLYPAGYNTPGYYSMSKFLGLTPGAYPPTAVNSANSTATYVANGAFAPMVQSTGVVNILCSLIRQDGFQPGGEILYSFSPQVATGEEIIERPHARYWAPIVDGNANNVTLTFVDENLNALQMQDPRVYCVLTIRGR